jgi:hypothetical protein
MTHLSQPFSIAPPTRPKMEQCTRSPFSPHTARVDELRATDEDRLRSITSLGRRQQRLPPHGRASRCFSTSRPACHRQQRRGSAPHRWEPLNEEAGRGIRSEAERPKASDGDNEGGSGCTETHYGSYVGGGNEGGDANPSDEDPISDLGLLSVRDSLRIGLCLRRSMHKFNLRNESDGRGRRKTLFLSYAADMDPDLFI